MHTTAIRNKLADREIPLESAEFALTVNDTQVLTAADFALRDHQTQDLDHGAKRLVLTLAHEGLGIEVQVRYEVAPAAPLLRKVLAVRTVGQTKPLLNRVEVEQFSTSAECQLGGLGQPVFIAGCIFTGLEYPAAQNQAKENAQAKKPTLRFSVALGHLPGKRLTPTRGRMTAARCLSPFSTRLLSTGGISGGRPSSDQRVPPLPTLIHRLVLVKLSPVGGNQSSSEFRADVP